MSTGDPRVDAALARLEALDGIPVGEHPEVVGDVHRALQEILAAEPPHPSVPAGG